MRETVCTYELMYGTYVLLLLVVVVVVCTCMHKKRCAWRDQLHLLVASARPCAYRTEDARSLQAGGEGSCTVRRADRRRRCLHPQALRSPAAATSTATTCQLLLLLTTCSHHYSSLYYSHRTGRHKHSLSLSLSHLSLSPI